MTPPTVQFIPASGPTLIIHDAFGGSGGLNGRTPDTIDNGNTWSTADTWTVQSGYVWWQAGAASDSYATIDPSSTSFSMEVDTYLVNGRNHGIVTHFQGASSNRSYFRWVFYGSPVRAEFRLIEIVGAITYSTLLANPVYLPFGSTFQQNYVCNGSSVDYEVISGGSTLISGSTSVRNTTDIAGFYAAAKTTHLRFEDLKVYT